MTEDQRVNVASVSKFVGAVATMLALQEAGIGVNTPIHTHLPPTWKAVMHADHFDGGSSTRVTYRNLMRMETGIQFPGTNPSPGAMTSNATMLQAIQLRADASRWGTYQNGNFCLLRVLIGEIVYDLDETAGDYAQTCADRYMEYVNTRLFTPIGVFDVSGGYTETYPPMSYEGPDLVGHTTDACTGYFGLAATDGTINNAGSGGLRLSSREMAAFLAYFMHAPNVWGLDLSTRDLILAEYLGLTSTPAYENPAHGTTPYYSKAGAFTAWDGTCVQAGRAHRSCVMIFAETGVEVGIITNSPFSVCNEIRDAYDAAW
jgi:CubicO group peptidase (beta-lactamase class C family)